MKRIGNNAHMAQGQSIVEYSIMIGVIITALLAMGPMIRRYSQAMIKMVSDQVGNQVNAEQRGGYSGHLVNSYTLTGFDREIADVGFQGMTGQEIARDETVTNSEVLSNLGFTLR